MTLLNQGLKIALYSAPLALVLAGCSSGDDTGKTDTSADNGGGDTDTDTDADSDTDSDTDADTGVAQLFFSGMIQTNNGNLTGGTYGLRLLKVGSLPTVDSACDIMGPVSKGADVPACDNCDWAFSFDVTGTTGVGSECDDFGVYDGMMDGSTGGWGWSDHYAYQYGSYTLDLTQNVWYYFTTYGQWYSLAFNYNGNPYGGYNYGDATDAEWNVGIAYYYYFYL